MTRVAKYCFLSALAQGKYCAYGMIRSISVQQKYSWVIPITGLGHVEMNMVKSFTEMFHDFDLKSFFETQGYTTPKALAFAKRCSDHHIAFDNLMKFRESLWLELIYVYTSVNTSHVSCDFE